MRYNHIDFCTVFNIIIIITRLTKRCMATYIRRTRACMHLFRFMVSISYRLASYQKKTAWSGQKREMLIRRLSLCSVGRSTCNFAAINVSTMASLAPVSGYIYRPALIYIASFYMAVLYTCIDSPIYSYGTVPFAYMEQSYTSMGQSNTRSY